MISQKVNANLARRSGSSPLHGSAAERAYRALKERILTCELSPGGALNEGRLAAEMAVSKTPIREALAVLVKEGFVEVLPRQGYRVRELAVADVQEIFQMLLLLEPAAASLAAQRATPEQLRELRALAEERDPPDFVAFVSRNREFHVRLAEAGGNARLAGTLRHTLEELQRIYLAGPDLRSAIEAHRGEHGDLVAALLKGNHHEAQSIAARQIEASRERMMDALFKAMSEPGGVGVKLTIDAGSTRR